MALTEGNAALVEEGASQPPTPVLCRVSKDALDSIVEIEAQCNAPAWSAQLLSDELQSENSHFFGAQCAETLVGYLAANIILTEAHILKFGVRTDWRRRGIGRALLIYSLTELKREGVKKCWLEVRASNAAAQRLYGQLGFKKISRRRSYYCDNGEDAVVMSMSYGT